MKLMTEKRCVRPLICPVCANPLAAADGSLRCPQGHTFDIAREGYVNLLLSGKKLAPTVGDSDDMVRARRAFLDGGHYEPLYAAVTAQVRPYLPPGQRPVVVDAGCGEGHTLQSVVAVRPDGGGCFFGVDVAKTAVRLAARRVKEGRFVVADVNRQLPFADGSVQVLLNLFAPRHAAEFGRVTAVGGLLLVVIPTPDHLESLRTRFSLLAIESGKRAAIARQLQGQFALLSAQTVRFELSLQPAALLSLIQMMPSARHLTAGQWEQVRGAPALSTAAGFELLAFQRFAG